MFSVHSIGCQLVRFRFCLRISNVYLLRTRIALRFVGSVSLFDILHSPRVSMVIPSSNSGGLYRLTHKSWLHLRSFEQKTLGGSKPSVPGLALGIFFVFHWLHFCFVRLWMELSSWELSFFYSAILRASIGAVCLTSAIRFHDEVEHLVLGFHTNFLFHLVIGWSSMENLLSSTLTSIFIIGT